MVFKLNNIVNKIGIYMLGWVVFFVIKIFFVEVLLKKLKS